MAESATKRLAARGFVLAATALLATASLLLSIRYVQRDICTDRLENEGGSVSGHFSGIWTYRCVYTAPFEVPHMRTAIRDHSTAFVVCWDAFWLTCLILVCASLVALLVRRRRLAR
jgi:hypothetical protein